jgi:protein-disulfide isomerase
MAACLLGLALGAYAAAAQTSVPVDQLMAPGPLPDIVQGSPDAPVTIVEYASLTCPHCAAFQEETLPKLKAKYVDTGEAKLILREYPLDPIAVAAAMVARCAGPERRTAVVDMLYARQKSWAFVDTPLDALAATVGISQADFEACLKNSELLKKVYDTRAHAKEAFNVNSTPTFFVNGQMLSGEQPIEEFDKTIQPLLK